MDEDQIKNQQEQNKRIGKFIEQEIGVNIPFFCLITFKSHDTKMWNKEAIRLDRSLMISNMNPKITPFLEFRDVISSAKHVMEQYYNFHFAPLLKDQTTKATKSDKENMYG